MKIIFTICSNNYLAQAKALGDSITKTNPDYKFFIGLVDELASEIDYETEIGFPIILTTEIGIPNFESLWKKYDIIELNTCVKPFYLEYFTNKYDDLSHLMYFDPDTFVFGNLVNIERELSGEKEIVLTPHILTPIPLDGKMPTESTFLNFGTYNLGFIGIKNPKNNLDFFKWWGERTYNIGFNRICEGLFVDQLWMNLTPILYQNTIVSFNYGLNMAPWNLHERLLTKDQNNNWLVNNKFELVFYHFSNYKFTTPTILANYYDRFTFEDRSDLVDFYEEYLQIILKNNILKLSAIPCKYVLLRNEMLEKIKTANILIHKKKTLLQRIKGKIKRILN